MLKKSLLIGAFALAPASITSAGPFNVIDGICSQDSHTAEGQIDSDLTKRQSRFFCNAAIIINYNDYKGHLLVQFAAKEASHSQLLAFAGRLDNENIMKVEHLYLGGAKPITVSDGYCKFFLKDQGISGIACGVKVDETGRRTVAIVGFDARRAGK